MRPVIVAAILAVLAAAAAAIAEPKPRRLVLRSTDEVCVHYVYGLSCKSGVEVGGLILFNANECP